MVNNISGPDVIERALSALDKGLQKVLAICKETQGELEKTYAGKLELLHLLRPDLAAEIEPAACRLYQEMAKTMFEVLRNLQPQDFENHETVNFYYWPGYHSYLTDKRIFCRMGERAFLGVGVCGDKDGAQTTYHDSCQARWYRFAVTPVFQDFPPASAYHWFEGQQPTVSDNPYDLVASLTFTTESSIKPTRDFPQHKIQHLTHGEGNSLTWGDEVASLLNGLEHLNNSEWRFPDRYDLKKNESFNATKDRGLRTLRLYLISLWLHSAFNTSKPTWWKELTGELQRQGLSQLSAAIESESVDPSARHWADRSVRRPAFTTLTTICFHPLIAPSPSPIIGPIEAHMGRSSATDVRNIGWATLLSSVPLRQPFISLIRDWIDRVYGTVRNTEVSLVLKHREPLERAAQMVRTLAHDMDKFMDEQIHAVLGEIDDCSPAVSSRRKFVILALRRLVAMTYGLTSAAPDPAKVIKYRQKFIESLAIGRDQLEDILFQMALDVQSHHRGRACVRIPQPKSPVDPVKSLDTYVSCLLLAGETVRNYCKYADPNSEGTLAMSLDDSVLTITLQGVTSRVPAGIQFGLLHNFLDGLNVGDARLTTENHKRVWTVRVGLGERKCS